MKKLKLFLLSFIIISSIYADNYIGIGTAISIEQNQTEFKSFYNSVTYAPSFNAELNFSFINEYSKHLRNAFIYYEYSFSTNSSTVEMQQAKLLKYDIKFKKWTTDFSIGYKFNYKGMTISPLIGITYFNYKETFGNNSSTGKYKTFHYGVKYNKYLSKSKKIVLVFKALYTKPKNKDHLDLSGLKLKLGFQINFKPFKSKYL